MSFMIDLVNCVCGKTNLRSMNSVTFNAVFLSCSAHLCVNEVTRCAIYFSGQNNNSKCVTSVYNT